MANIKSFPNNQDEYIGAENVMKWLHGRTSGVFAAENNAAVSAVQGEMAVNASDGLGWMANAGKDGVVWWIDNEAVNGTKLKLSIDPADSALNRIDRIIVEWKTTNYVDYPEVKVLKGSLASNPTAPALTNNSTVRQISLARVNVAAGTTAITASMITDERLDASVCGLVTESISIDTTTMQNQFEELLTAIQTELQNLNAGTECVLKTSVVNNFATTEEGFVADARALKILNDSKLSMDLLWENASPSSEFAAQTIELDLSAYSHVMIETVTTPGSLIVRKGASAEMATVYVGKTDSTKTLVQPTRRITSVSDTKVSFTDALTALYKSSTAVFGDTNLNNDAVVPFRIYGVKGVV